jgi:multidrug efflux system outer membrane protein
MKQIALIAILLCLAGCAPVGPKYQKPTVITPPAFKEPPPAGWKEAQPRDEAAKGNWWIIFDDPTLNNLEAQATAENQSLKIAVAHVEEARALAKLARADRVPALRSDVNLAPGRAAGNRPVQPNSSTQSYFYNSITLPLDMSYEVDLFGRVRSNIAAANATIQINQASYESVLLTLKSDVARTYFMLRGIDTDRSVLKRNIEVLGQALDLAKRRHEGGVASGLDVSEAETLLASTQADYIGEGRIRQQVEHALAVLCGQPASAFTVAEQYMLRTPPVIPEGLPSDLLERRPDIAAAERLLAANNARIGIARAAFFPTLNLTDTAGFLSQSLLTLLSGNSGTMLFGSLLSIPIFQGGRPQANLDYAKKVYEESVDAYRQQVLVAFQETEDALSDLRVLQEQGAAIDVTLKSAQRTVDISTARYQQGLANYLAVLDAQRTVLANERLAAQTLGFRMIASVQLSKALGGGWQDQAKPTP